MNNEFYLKYNQLRDYKYDNFDKYTKDMVSAYSSMDTLSSSLSVNETLSYGWKKLLASMDKVIEKRDKIDSWWTNYLENIRRLEQGLPDQVNQINKYNVHQYAMEHSVGSAPTTDPTIYEPTPATPVAPVESTTPATPEPTSTGVVPLTEETAKTVPGVSTPAASPTPTVSETPAETPAPEVITGTPAPEVASSPAISGVPLTRNTAEGEVTVNPTQVLTGARTASQKINGNYVGEQIETLE